MTINCPECGGATTVTRNYSDGETLWRRRQCKVCKTVFHTTEEQKVSSEKHFLELQNIHGAEQRYRQKYGAVAGESQNKVKGNSNGH